jgi:uncharacterized glyoxalase superfamily protein PhnB
VYPRHAPAERDGRAPGAGWSTPGLFVNQVDQSLAFYEKAFGFRPSPGTRKDREGTIVHAEMSHEGVPLFTFSCYERTLYDVAPPRMSNVTCPVIQYVYCRDVDELAAQARAAGATVLAEPQDMPWGDRMCRIEDLDGYLWSFATYQGIPILC